MQSAAEQSEATPHVPGEVGVWVFILGDMTVFALFFATFIYYRSADVALFTAAQAQLSQNLGALNTLLLLASSWFVVLAVNSARQHRFAYTPWLLALGLLCGLGFCVVKVFEYSEKIGHGITPATNDFFMYYFVFTGIHFVHVLIGSVVLGLLIWHAGKRRDTGPNMQLLEGGASFWHMVDLLWIVLFPLIYLIK